MKSVAAAPESSKDAPVRRLLVLTYHYPPDGAVGGLRWSGFAKYLVRRGWEVHIVTASVKAGDVALPGTVVHVAPRRRTLNDIYNSAAGRFKRGDGATPTPTSVPSHPQRPALVRTLLGPIRSAISRSLAFPDVSRGWVMRAATMARRVLREHQFDAVVSSGPPHFSHLAAMLATAGSPVPLWVDMRDPWSAVHEMFDEQSLGARVERAVVARLERMITRAAWGLVANTPEFAAELRGAVPGGRIFCVHNAVDAELLPTERALTSDGCRLAYVGTIYAARNLTSVIAAMRLLVRDDPSVAARLRLSIAGHISPEHREQLDADLAAEGMTHMVEILGVTSRADALRLVSSAHLALVLAQNQPLCVPAKLYESLALGVPTLAITENGSATAHEAQRIGAMAADPADLAAIRRVIEDALAGRLPQRVTPTAPISYAERVLEIERVLLSGQPASATPATRTESPAPQQSYR